MRREIDVKNNWFFQAVSLKECMGLKQIHIRSNTEKIAFETFVVLNVAAKIERERKVKFDMIQMYIMKVEFYPINSFW